MSTQSLLQWLEGRFAFVPESTWGFPILVTIHLLGIALSVGTLVWFDLRLLGVSMRGLPVSQVYRRLAPWTLSGFAVMVLTGGTLFSGFATRAYENGYFRLKMAAIVLAAVNALYFHFVTERGIARWDDDARPPAAARMAGLVSIVLWAWVIVAGRMMSYTMF
jgi:hypothetical protein